MDVLSKCIGLKRFIVNEKYLLIYDKSGNRIIVKYKIGTEFEDKCVLNLSTLKGMAVYGDIIYMIIVIAYNHSKQLAIFRKNGEEFVFNLDDAYVSSTTGKVEIKTENKAFIVEGMADKFLVTKLK